MPSNPVCYGRGMRWFHWGMFALVVLAYLGANLHGVLPRGSAARANVLAGHFLAGIAVFLLVWPRIWLRFKGGVPPIHPPLNPWLRGLSGLTHLALYAFLVVQPLLGFVTAQYTGKKIGLFGITVIPQWVTVDNDFGHRLEDVHVFVADLFYWIIGLHILAALWHHYVTRDDTLVRMLPPRGEDAG